MSSGVRVPNTHTLPDPAPAAAESPPCWGSHWACANQRAGAGPNAGDAGTILSLGASARSTHGR